MSSIQQKEYIINETLQTKSLVQRFMTDYNFAQPVSENSFLHVFHYIMGNISNLDVDLDTANTALKDIFRYLRYPLTLFPYDSVLHEATYGRANGNALIGIQCNNLFDDFLTSSRPFTFSYVFSVIQKTLFSHLSSAKQTLLFPIKYKGMVYGYFTLFQNEPSDTHQSFKFRNYTSKIWDGLPVLTDSLRHSLDNENHRNDHFLLYNLPSRKKCLYLGNAFSYFPSKRLSEEEFSNLRSALSEEKKSFSISKKISTSKIFLFDNLKDYLGVLKHINYHSSSLWDGLRYYAAKSASNYIEAHPELVQTDENVVFQSLQSLLKYNGAMILSKNNDQWSVTGASTYTQSSHDSDDFTLITNIEKHNLTDFNNSLQYFLKCKDGKNFISLLEDHLHAPQNQQQPELINIENTFSYDISASLLNYQDTSIGDNFPSNSFLIIPLFNDFSKNIFILIFFSEHSQAIFPLIQDILNTICHISTHSQRTIQIRTDSSQKAKDTSLAHYGHTLAHICAPVLKYFFTEDENKKSAAWSARQIKSMNLILQAQSIYSIDELLELNKSKNDRFLSSEDDLDIQKLIKEDISKQITSTISLKINNTDHYIQSYPNIIFKVKNPKIKRTLQTPNAKTLYRLKDSFFAQIFAEIIINALRHSMLSPSDIDIDTQTANIDIQISKKIHNNNTILCFSNWIKPNTVPANLNFSKWTRWPALEKHHGPEMAIDFFRKLKLGDLWIKISKTKQPGIYLFRTGLTFQGLTIQ